jgi:hypothetical protein
MPGQEPPGQVCHRLPGSCFPGLANPAGGASPRRPTAGPVDQEEAVNLARASRQEIRMFPISRTRTAQNQRSPGWSPNRGPGGTDAAGPITLSHYFAVIPAQLPPVHCSVAIGSRSWPATRPPSSSLPSAGGLSRRASPVPTRRGADPAWVGLQDRPAEMARNRQQILAKLCGLRGPFPSPRETGYRSGASHPATGARDGA